MDFRLTEEQVEFQKEVKDWLKSVHDLTEKAVREEERGSYGENTFKFHRAAGAKGYLTPHWPKEWGGLGKSHMDKHLASELMSYSVGMGAVGTGESMAGPCIMLYGTDEQKKLFLPSISKGEVEWALGYTEPGAGSDLASLEMRAVKQGDHYVINGNKVFNTSCHYAKYHWLAARTNPNVKKHLGISMFIVDMNTPGITINPMYGMGGVRTNEVFYDDVKVPVSRLVGEENKGWEYLQAALAYERNWQTGIMQHDFENLVNFCKKTKRDGKLLIEDPLVREDIAQLAIDLEVSRLFGLRVACMIEKEVVPSYEAAIGKVFGSELFHRILEKFLKLVSLYGQLKEESEDSDKALNAKVMQLYFLANRSVLTRGTNDVLRNTIAMRGLGMPRG